MKFPLAKLEQKKKKSREEKKLEAEIEKLRAELEKKDAQLAAENDKYMRMLAEAYDSADKKEFYEFTLALDALKQSLSGDENTVILDGQSELAKILTGAMN